MTRVDLDNGCVRITLKCTHPKCHSVYFFNPPDADNFSYFISSTNQDTYVVDIPKDAIKKNNDLTIGFGGSYSFIYVARVY